MLHKGERGDAAALGYIACSDQIVPPVTFQGVFWKFLTVSACMTGQATGLGAHMALPLLRKSWREDLTEEEARKLLVDCMRVLFYRDTRASAKLTIGKVCRPHQFPSRWHHTMAAIGHLPITYLGRPAPHTPID